MGLWGAGAAGADAKPKYLTDTDKRNCTATPSGWTVPAGGNARAGADREVLVAIRGLSGATKMAEANISNVSLLTNTIGAAAGGDVNIIVTFNENVTVTGTPHVELTNVTEPSRSTNIVYASGSGTNRLNFTSTVAGGALTEADVVGVILMRLDGGTIVDTSGGATALITFDPIAKQITVGA